MLISSSDRAAALLSSFGLSFRESGLYRYGWVTSKEVPPVPMMRFQCPECGMGDREVGHLVAEPAGSCVVCLDEQGRLIRLECWQELSQARLRDLAGHTGSS